MLAQLAFAGGDPLVMQFQHPDPGVRGGAAGIGFAKQLGQEIVRDAHIVRIAQVIL